MPEPALPGNFTWWWPGTIEPQFWGRCAVEISCIRGELGGGSRQCG